MALSLHITQPHQILQNNHFKIIYEKLHNSSHPNAQRLDELYKNVKVGYQNYCDAVVNDYLKWSNKQ